MEACFKWWTPKIWAISIDTLIKDSHRDAIDALIDNSGIVIIANDDKASVFNSYYASVGVMDNGYIPICHDLEVQTMLETITFTEAGAVAAITKLKPNLSSGTDM